MSTLLMNNDVEGENYPPQLLSQKLNNRATLLTTMDNYKEGITLQ
jgi:hypothetical protein